jgi:hypothetical protein
LSIDNAIWIIGAAGELAVFIASMRHKLWRTLPLFSAYVAWLLASDVITYLVFHKADSLLYGRWYIDETAIDSVLQFAVLVELGWSVLRPVRKSLPRGSLIVLIVLTALAGLLIWPITKLNVPLNFTSNSLLLFQMQETVAILRIACFLVMASFSQLLSINWRDRELQVATGLGIYSIVSLLVSVLHSHQVAGDSYHHLDQIAAISYVSTLSYWVFSFATKEQERKEFSPQMQQFLLLMGGGARAGRIALSDLPSERPRKRIK